MRAKKRQEMEQYADYRNYLSFSMFEQVTDEQGMSFVKILSMIWQEEIPAERAEPEICGTSGRFCNAVHAAEQPGFQDQAGALGRGHFLRWIRSGVLSA